MSRFYDNTGILTFRSFSGKYLHSFATSIHFSISAMFIFLQNWHKIQGNNVTGYFRIQSYINPTNPYANNLINGT